MSDQLRGILNYIGGADWQLIHILIAYYSGRVASYTVTAVFEGFFGRKFSVLHSPLVSYRKDIHVHMMTNILLIVQF